MNTITFGQKIALAFTRLSGLNTATLTIASVIDRDHCFLLRVSAYQSSPRMMSIVTKAVATFQDGAPGTQKLKHG